MLATVLLSTACVEPGPGTGIMGSVAAVDGLDGCTDEDGDPLDFTVTVLEVGAPPEARLFQAVSCHAARASAFSFEVPPGSYTVTVSAYQDVLGFRDLEREQVGTIDVGDGEIIDLGLINLDVNDDNEPGVR